MSISAYNSLVAQRVVNKIKSTFSYTGVRAYFKLKERKKKEKRLTEMDVGLALSKFSKSQSFYRLGF